MVRAAQSARERGVEKICDARFGVIDRAPWRPANEADVSAPTGELQLQIGIVARNLANFAEDLRR